VRRRLLVLALISLLVAVPLAHGYVFKAALWPGGTVYYYNAAPDQAWAVQEAVRAWNTSGARVRFVPAAPGRAELTIRSFPHRRCVDHAKATIGYVRGATVYLPRLDPTSEVCNHFASAQMVAHELGHVLGLHHENRGCARMNATGSWNGPTRCHNGERWQWRCGLVEHDDASGVVRFYGGTVRVPTDGRLCNAYTAAAPPGALTAQYRHERASVALRFRRPAEPVLPDFLALRAAADGAYALTRARDACPTDVRAAARYRWRVAVGAQEELFDRPPAAGNWCYAVWAVDRYGRQSDSASWAWVSVPAD